MSRDRSVTSDEEKQLFFWKRIALARHNETMRVIDQIEMAMCESETEETQKVLLGLAIKVIQP